MSKVTAQEVHPRPYNWQPERARNLPDTWYYVEKHRSPALPISAAMFVVIFFEEAACCNTVQKPPYAIGPGQIQVADYGPKHFFAGVDYNGNVKDNFMGKRWDSSMTTWAISWKTGRRLVRPKPVDPNLPKLMQNEILADFEFGVKMHIKLMEWEWKGHGNGKPKSSLGALLGAQLGGQTAAMRQSAMAAFVRGSRELDALVRHKPQLNFGPNGNLKPDFYMKRRIAFANVLNPVRSQIKGNPVGFKQNPKFWEFFLPDGFLENPLGYLRWGF